MSAKQFFSIVALSLLMGGASAQETEPSGSMPPEATAKPTRQEMRVLREETRERQRVQRAERKSMNPEERRQLRRDVSDAKSDIYRKPPKPSRP